MNVLGHTCIKMHFINSYLLLLLVNVINTSWLPTTRQHNTKTDMKNCEYECVWKRTSEETRYYHDTENDQMAIIINTMNAYLTKIGLVYQKQFLLDKATQSQTLSSRHLKCIKYFDFVPHPGKVTKFPARDNEERRTFAFALMFVTQHISNCIKLFKVLVIVVTVL